MAEFLILTLVAPLGSFGDLAGHERRGSGQWPARSAILGLLGAAHGVRRGDKAGQAALDIWNIAVGALATGTPLRDYHTVQTIPSTIRRPNSRPAALAEAKRRGVLNTVLTSRDYLTDCAFRVALWGGDLAAAAAALREPVFIPYLGRKSCPLSAPMDPHRVTADDPVAALCVADPMADRILAEDRHANWPPLWRNPGSVALDHWPGLAGQTETRWDQPIDRDRWHFAARSVTMVTP